MLFTHDDVLVGGASYSGRWHGQARFAKRHTGALRTRPVWLFSSGPVNGSAEEAIRPVPQVQELLERIGARGWPAEVSMSWCRLTCRGSCVPNRRHELQINRTQGERRGRSHRHAAGAE